MAKKEYRLGVEEANLVKRQLRLLAASDDAISAAMGEIDEIYGVNEIGFDEKSRNLSVSYDATRICIQCVEDVLSKHNIALDQGWWNRFKEKYYRFVDENIQANAKHEPFSCHKVPPHK